MVFKSQRVRIIIVAGFAILILLDKVQLAAQAQLEPAKTPNTAPSSSEPTIELDIQAMVASSSGFANSVVDDVWELEAPPGMVLLQLPIHVKPGVEAGQIQSSTLSIRGGQVLAWQVGKSQLSGSDRRVADHRPTTSQSLSRSGRSSGVGPMGPLGGLVGPDLLSHGRDGSRRRTPRRNRKDPKKAARQAIEVPPPDSWNTLPPRLARKIVVDPEGVVTWKLDRAFPGGIANAADQLYALKIDPKLLDRYNPGPSPKITRDQDESPTEFRARKHKEQDEYRRQANAFRELRKRVVDLPTQFEQADLPHLWAIVRAHAGKRAIVIDDHTQPPWNIALDQIQATGGMGISQVSGKRHSRDEYITQLSDDQVQLISKMVELVRNEHPYNFRLAAYVLAKAGLPPLREETGQLYQLLETLLAGPDQEARMAVIVHLASITPPTNASISLLHEARELMNPQMKLAALRSFLLADTTELEQLLATINRDLLADTQGPPAGDVIRALLQAVDDRPDLVNLLATGIQFDPLSPDRCDQAIATVLDMAAAKGYRNTNIASSELAATWIDQQLLGSNDRAVVHRTLESLNSWPAIITATPNHTDPIALISIGSVDHSFYRLLQHEDPQLRTMAWQALRHFTFPTQRQSSRRRRKVDNVSNAYQKLADAALARQPTPKSIVTFLDNQGDLPQVTAQLVRLVRQADKEVSHAAARALRGSNRRINTSLEQLTLDQRYVFASAFYEAQTGKVPLVVGLMRHNHRHTPVIDWFAEQIAQGKLPEPVQWINAFRNDEELLEIAGSSDEQLALAATATMVFSAGGDEAEVNRLREQFRQSDQSFGVMQSIWGATRQRLNTNRLNDSVGTYILVINTYGKARDEEDQDRQQPMMAPGMGLLPPPSNSFGPLGSPTGGSWRLRQSVKKTGKPDQVLNLGPVQLQVDGDKISFANHAVTLSVRSKYMAICIENPSQLKNFPNEQLAQLPLEEAIDPIDLLPTDTGSWTGDLQLPDSRIVELIMTPHPPD